MVAVCSLLGNCAQSNQLPDEAGKDPALNSRMLRIDFDELRVDQDTEPNLYAHWTCVKELISALLPDFASLLWEGKLDSEAIQDCANFIQATVSTTRDRNANMWGVMLYFMLVLNALFQCTPDDQEAVFDWVVRSASRSIREISVQGGLIERFVLSVHRVLQLRTNPLGHESATLSLHNLRKLATPFDLNLRITGPSQFIALRVASVVGVLAQVLRVQFDEQELLREARRQSKGLKNAEYVVGKCLFYDCSRNPYPIKRTVVDELTRIATDIPLSESELEQTMCKSFNNVLFIKKSQYDELTSGEEEVVEIRDYKKILIWSANPKQGEYNLYEVCTFSQEDSLWFGYRVCDTGPLRNYNGFRNWMHCGGPTISMDLIADVVRRNKAAGFGSIYDCYTPKTMLEYLNYELPDLDKVPVCYKEIPFKLRNEDDDSLINYKCPPWMSMWYGENGMGSYLGEVPSDIETLPGVNNTVDSLSRVFNKRIVRDDDGETEQSSSVRSPVSEPPTACSSPARPSNVTARGHTGPSPKRKAKSNEAKKRRKKSKFILDEADDEDEEVQVKTQRPPTPHTPHPKSPLTHACFCFVFIQTEVVSSDEDVANQDDLDFIDDTALEEDTYPYATGYCQNVIDILPNGEEIFCHDLCNPSEQYCKLCRQLMRLF